MSLSRSGKPDPDLEGVELLFHQKVVSASFGAKMALSLNRADPGCMNQILDPLVEQSAQRSYMILRFGNKFHISKIRLYKILIQISNRSGNLEAAAQCF
jgi:hypothetical protein